MISSITSVGAGLLDGAWSLSQAPSNTMSAAGGLSFSQTLGQVVSDAIGTIQNGEAAAIQGITGAMPTFKVVEQVMGAQRTLQEALSVRDKAVSAYQEITRMSI